MARSIGDSALTLREYKLSIEFLESDFDKKI